MKKSMKLKIGQQAPDFQATVTGKQLSLADFHGKWLIIYFFPRTNTPHCTKESCSLRDGNNDLRSCGAEILGISLNSAKKQADFKEKHSLPFTLISDENKKICKAYNALAPFALFAKRKTYIISPTGMIAYIFHQINCSDHANEVVKKLDQLIHDLQL